MYAYLQPLSCLLHLQRKSDFGKQIFKRDSGVLRKLFFMMVGVGDAISKAFVEGRTHKFIVQRLNLK